MFNYNLLKLIRHVRNVYHIARALESAFLAANQPNRIVESSIPGFIYIYFTIESFEYSNSTFYCLKQKELVYTNVEILCNFPCVNLPFVQIQFKGQENVVLALF